MELDQKAGENTREIEYKKRNFACLIQNSKSLIANSKGWRITESDEFTILEYSVGLATFCEPYREEEDLTRQNDTNMEFRSF